MVPIPKLARFLPGWYQPSPLLFRFVEDQFVAMFNETWDSMRTEDQAGLQPIVVGMMWRNQVGEKRYLCWRDDKAQIQRAEVMDLRMVNLIDPPKSVIPKGPLFFHTDGIL